MLVVAAAGVVYLALNARSSHVTTPKDAVRTLLDAGMNNDVKKADTALCASDRAAGQVSHLQSAGRITHYQLGVESDINGVRYVSASYATTSSGPVSTTEQFPVVKEGGSWRVCFTQALATAPSTQPSAVPSVLLPRHTTGPGQPAQPGRTAVPTGTAAAALCTDSTSSFGVAQTYVGLAEIGVPQAAQACVYQGRVPVSVAAQLKGKVFLSTTEDQHAAVIDFRSTDGSTRLTVTTAKEPDGNYYVTAVSVG